VPQESSLCLAFETNKKCIYATGTSVLNNVNANWLSAGWGPGGGIPRRDTEDHVDDLKCVRPNVIGFTTEDGKEHLVKVPEGTLDELNEWVKTENFAKLLELESVSGDA
jgi:agmatine/peptidylarginine deiminase